MVYSLKLLVVGSEGFIGSHFCRALPQAKGISKKELDLCCPSLDFSTEGYTHALIAAGIGNPQRCEEDPERSYRCNVEGTLELGKELRKRGMIPIFISTDYALSALNTYGRQKAILEKEASRLDALILRLSKVYGVEKGDGTLFDEMAAKLSKGEQVLAAKDQVFAPLFIDDLIRKVSALIEKRERGIVNITGPVATSRLEMARKMAEELNVEMNLVKEISLDELNDGICRPKKSPSCSGIDGISWREGVERNAKNYAKN